MQPQPALPPVRHLYLARRSDCWRQRPSKVGVAQKDKGEPGRVRNLDGPSTGFLTGLIPTLVSFCLTPG